jgi:phosphoglucomutase
MISGLDTSIQNKINQWLGNSFDSKTNAAVQQLIDENRKDDLIEAFYKDLEFGTGGLRGIMGVGSNRINKYTLGKATQGLSNYLKKVYPDEQIKVAVSYDSRNNSKEFAKIVADVFSSNDIIVYFFEEMRPTPVLSFAIRELGCHSGVMLTASHNPKEYNGYKAYWKDGGQLVAPHDQNAITEVNAIESNSQINFEAKDENIKLLGADIDHLYIQKIKELSIRPDVVLKQKDLKVVFSPIHGTGITMVPAAFKAWGFSNLMLVESQAEPNGNFPTVIYPNPEEEEAMSLALAEGIKQDADLIMATDPDADRVGVAIKNLNGEYQLLNGNQIGSLLIYYVLSSKQEQGVLKENDYIVKTIVTSSLIEKIADSIHVKCYDVLTGFKFIGELMTNKEGEERFLVGGEESYGYLIGDLVRDKDAVISSVFIAEMTAYYKDQGKSLFDALIELYLQFGYYKEKLIAITKEGKSGAEEISNKMIALRQNPPKQLGGIEVAEVKDYLQGVSGLPKSNVLQFITVEGDVISARPSGTEPKIKFYCSVKGALKAAADFDTLSQKLDDKLERIMADLM